MSENNFY